MVDYMFDSIKASEQRVLEDEGLSTAEKIQEIPGVLPDGYKDVDFRQLYLLREKYPKIYKKVERRLETGWQFAEQYDEGMLAPRFEDAGMTTVRLPHTCRETPFHYFDEHCYQMVCAYRRVIAAKKGEGYGTFVWHMGGA